MKAVTFMVALLISANASASGLPAYLKEVVRLVPIYKGLDTAGALDGAIIRIAVGDAKSLDKVPDVKNFRDQFVAFRTRNAWNPETLVGQTFIPVGQVVANGQTTVFSALNFYVVQQRGVIQVALAAKDSNKLTRIAALVDESGIDALQGVRQARTVTVVPMQDGTLMQMITFNINRNDLDEAALEGIVRLLRDVVGKI